MEEKRRDAGTLAPSSSFAGAEFTSEPASSRRRAGGQKRKASNLSSVGAFSAPSKRLAREKGFLSYPPIHSGPLTRARLGDFAAAIGGASSSPAVAAKQEELVSLQDGAAVDELRRASREWEALEASIDGEVEAIRSRDPNAHVVPSHCGWFSWTKLHSVEELSLPSFFNGKSSTQTPDMYMEIRNWIMEKFHANPNTQIALKDLSELEVGDLAARQEVMEFLDYWGLINFHPLLPKESTTASVHSDDVEEKSTLVEKLYHFEVQQLRPIAPKTSITTLTMASRLVPESSIAEEFAGPEGPNVEYHCNSCSADCSRKRYHCQKQADFDLCSDCFSNGKFDSNMSLSDFIVMEPAEVLGLSGGKWTDQETLLLLEALELYKENWNEIADHVATKTKTQCILHFVQMPIEDAFLDYDEDTHADSKDPTDNAVPNADSSNPKDVPESTETKTDDCEGQPQISSMETSNPEDANKREDDHENLKADKGSEAKSCLETLKHEDTVEVKIIQETGESFALKALRDAFEAVGYPTTEGPLSFADVGNPVMALAAYLARLVEPDIVTASSHCSLRSISGVSSGTQLAARHCFLLEDLPDDNKELGSCESTGTVDKGAQEDAVQVEKIQKEDNSSIDLRNTNISDDNVDKKVEDLAVEEKRLPDDDESTEKLNATKEADATGKLEAGPCELNESSKSERLGGQPPSTSKKSDDLALKVEHVPSSGTDSDNQTPVGDPSHSTEAQNNVDMTSESLPSENVEPQKPVVLKPVEEPSESTEAAKNVDMVSDSLPPEKTVEQEPNTANGTGEVDKQKSEENKEKSDSMPKKGQDVDKIKRAATAALSAAAVKAKFLANQEEEQIKELAASLIDKQLRKLETKLGFFSEMDNAMTMVKEQMDRLRQRLFHERAQIIAARLGSAAPSSRAMPPNFVNSAPRPPMSMGALRPQLPRPLGAMTSNPNPLTSTQVAGGSVRPSG